MPFYHRLGQIPRKRHLVFRRPDGGLHSEELVGNKGFTGPSSLLYHLRPPTTVESVRALRRTWPVEAGGGERPAPPPLPHRAGWQPGRARSSTACRCCSTPTWRSRSRGRRGTTSSTATAQGDEIVFVSEGRGALESAFGELAVRAGDYVVIPRGILHRWRSTRPAALPRDRERRLRAHAEALSQRARPAHSRCAPYSRARHPPAGAAA